MRMDYLNKDTMNNYFELLKDTLVENNLLECPNRIYVDEIGMPLNHSALKIVTGRGQKIRYRKSGNESQITVIGCVSATGHAIPPFVIFDSTSLNMEWRKVRFLALPTV